MPPNSQLCDTHTEAIRVHEHRLDAQEAVIASLSNDIKESRREIMAGQQEILGRLDRVAIIDNNQAHLKEAQERAFKAIGAVEARLVPIESTVRNVSDIKTKVDTAVTTLDTFAGEQKRIEGMLTTLKWIGYALCGIISVAAAVLQALPK